MKQQTLKNKDVTPLQGIGLIALIVGAMVGASSVSQRFAESRLGVWFSALIWLAAIGIAIFLMRERILEYHYTISEDVLYVERVLGTRTKVLEHVPLTDILACGPLQEVQAKYPTSQGITRATLSGVSLTEVALAYREAGEARILVLQPEAEFLCALWDEERVAQRKRDKWGEDNP